jgi:membrane fusion protein (multidrug efflux system)
MARPALILASSLWLTLATLQGCKEKDANAEANLADSTESGSDSSGMALPVAGQEVRQGDLILSVVTTGQVRSDAYARLKAETGGTVTEVLVTPGQLVRKGQPLVKLDPRPFDIAVREAEAALEQAMIAYRDFIVPDSIATGQAVPEDRRKNAESRAGVTSARVRLERAKLDQERATIDAPFDGIVDEVHVAAGERVGGGDDIASVVDVGNLRIEAQVLEHDLPLIRVGGEAVITAAAQPDQPVYGRVIAVLPMIDSLRRAGRALIRARNNGLLRPGMYADVRLEANRLRDRVIVPSRAVIERDGRPLVFVVRNSQAEWVYITPGKSNRSETEVLADSVTGQVPLAAGDTVLVEGHLTLTHGAPVRVVSAREQAP